MKKYYFLLLFLFPLLVEAQIIRYDTIRVSLNDERNIHRNAQQQNVATQNQPSPPLRVNRTETAPLGFDKSKLRFGANVGLSLSRNYTTLGIGPQTGYQFSDYFMAGAGVKYYYTRTNTYNYEVKNNLLGANLFGYAYPVRFITVFVQPELNYIWWNMREKAEGRKETGRGFVPSVIIGAGLRLGRSHITLNYDLVRDVNSPYPDRIFWGISTFF